MGIEFNIADCEGCCELVIECCECAATGMTLDISGIVDTPAPSPGCVSGPPGTVLSYANINGSYSTSDVTCSLGTYTGTFHVGTYHDTGDPGILYLQSWGDGGTTLIESYYIWKIYADFQCSNEVCPENIAKRTARFGGVIYEWQRYNHITATWSDAPGFLGDFSSQEESGADVNGCTDITDPCACMTLADGNGNFCVDMTSAEAVLCLT